jgi:hypothetical protein
MNKETIKNKSMEKLEHGATPTIWHLSSSIDGLLSQKPALLGRLFNMNGKEAKAELLALKAKGHRLIPSDNCDRFCPEKGCLGHVKKAETILKGE